MGIPLYFNRIIREYPELVLKSLSKKYKKANLYLDFNCLIHPCCHRVLKQIADRNLKLPKDKIEGMFKYEINQYTQKLCSLFGKNGIKLDTLVISIDGIAPQAKMVQQRSRRFRSVIYKNEVRKIDQMFQKPPNKNEWDTNAITPGTEFMHDLSNYLQDMLKSDEYYKTIPTRILSDASVPGEGEHKIMEYLRNNKEHVENVDNDENDENDENIDSICDTATIIYGLDADLIMLSMASKYEHIYLLRESVHFGQVQDDSFCYLDIPTFKSYLFETITENIDGDFKDNLDIDLLVQDYIFLCFFVGNDFLPNLPSLHIKQDGIDYILDIYKDLLCMREEYLICDNEINIGFLKSLFIKLKVEEGRKLEDRHRAFYRRRFTRDTRLNRHGQAIKALDMQPIIMKEPDKIIPNKEGWEERYYYQLFKLKNINKDKEPIQNICRLYLQGLSWTTAYYFKGCVSWRWAYYFNHAPCLNELIETLDTMTTLNPDDIFSEGTQPLRPFQQLLSVLPPQSKELLPPKYRELMTHEESPILHYYPTRITLENYLAYYFHYCEPRLPILYVDEIIEATRMISLTEKERKLNNIGEKVVVFVSK
jgi:5'-3' exonuclease